LDAFTTVRVGFVLRGTTATPVLVAALAWKVATELLFPITDDSFWEFVERGGSYGAPLALLVLRRTTRWATAPARSLGTA
jgi:hypothetical protein